MSQMQSVLANTQRPAYTGLACRRFRNRSLCLRPSSIG